MSALVTGAGGFVGQWLLRALLESGDNPTAFTLGPPPLAGVLTRDQLQAVRWINGDVRDAKAITAAVEREFPDVVYHLAGVTFVPAAGSDPVATYDVNTISAARLLTAIGKASADSKAKVRVIIIGSGEQYGSHPANEQPLSEAAAQRPATVYAASKCAQEMIALQLGTALGIDVVATRSFNHSGPGQQPSFLLPALVQRVKAAVMSGATRFPIGNTTPVRDFLHVSDVVRAYLALAKQGRPGEAYNVSSGRSTSVGDLVKLVLRAAGSTATPETEESLVRLVDVEMLVGDSAKLRRETGWNSQRSVEDIVTDLLAADGRVWRG